MTCHGGEQTHAGGEGAALRFGVALTGVGFLITFFGVAFLAGDFLGDFLGAISTVFLSAVT